MKYLKQDIVSSLVVFVVALPLSLGIAIASGVPPQMAIVSAILGGIVAGILTGAPLTVTGPAAGLSALILQIVQEYGLQSLAFITVGCGLFQVFFGLVRSGKWFDRFPETIIQGMLSAIGLAIIIGQLHILAGKGIPGNPLTSAMGLFSTFSSPNPTALLVGVLSIAGIFYWTKIAPKKLAWIPGALPIVILATLSTTTFEIPKVEISPILSHAKESFFAWSGFSVTSVSYSMILAAFGVAIVASAESLLTAKAGDQLINDPSHPKSRLNHELCAQGVTNLISGTVGGMPMTSVIVRTAANINAGAKTRMSTILHGIWIMVFVVLLPKTLEMIPLTALAAVLIVTGIKLLSIPYWKKLLHREKLNFFYGFSTIVLILGTDLLKGLIGALLIYFIAEKIKSMLKKVDSTQNQAVNDVI